MMPPDLAPVSHLVTLNPMDKSAQKIAALEALISNPIPGDQWLNLNLWAPHQVKQAPEMVWIHGGAFAYGDSAQPMYNGERFAERGVVLIPINYRVAVEGFTVFPDTPSNRGLADQIAALT